jgi:hypothetical protein
LRRSFVLAGAAAIALATGFLAWKGDRVVEKVLDLRFGAVLPNADFPSPRGLAEANRQDIDYLARLLEVDRSFSESGRAEFLRRVAALRARAADLSRAQLFLGVAEAVAAADNAHTNVKEDAWAQMLNAAPVKMKWYPEGLFVVRATADNAPLLGARVTSIGGYDPALLAREAARFFGGPAQFAHTSSPMVLDSPQALHGMHAELPDDRVKLSVVDAQGRAREVELHALGPPNSDTAWQSVMGRIAEPPPSLRDPSFNAFWTRLADDVLYLHLWRVRDVTPGSLEADVRKALGPESDPRWRRIILDLRFNGGGEYQSVYAAIRDLPKRLAPDGKLMILIDNTTFSAAIIVAGLAKHFTGARATYVGESPRDRMAFWAEGNFIDLPNSKIRVTTSTAYHDWEHGCRELRCYWLNYWYDVAAGRVEPDIAVGWRFADYRRGVDTVLERARE